MLRKRAGQVLSLGKLVIQRPSQVRHLLRSAKVVGKHPLEVRTPWLAWDLIDWLNEQLRPEWVVFEYGGGGSTAFLADRVARVITAEHDPDWGADLHRTFDGVANVEVLQCSPSATFADYVSLIERCPQDSLDLVIVDGRERVDCVKRSVPYVRPGGWIVLDDSERERYQPAFKVLQDWTRRDFRGLAPWKATLGCTTAWQKPTDVVIAR